VSDWFVYIIRCSDGSLYTGITTDLERRFEEHRSGKGAKYFRGRQALEIAYLETCADRSQASCREAAIKSLPRAEKMRLVQSSAWRRSPQTRQK